MIRFARFLFPLFVLGICLPAQAAEGGIVEPKFRDVKEWARFIEFNDPNFEVITSVSQNELWVAVAFNAARRSLALCWYSESAPPLTSSAVSGLLVVNEAKNSLIDRNRTLVESSLTRRMRVVIADKYSEVFWNMGMENPVVDLAPGQTLRVSARIGDSQVVLSPVLISTK